MRPECILAVETPLGRAVREGEAQRIKDAIKHGLRELARSDPARWRAMTRAERLEQVSAAASAEMTRPLREKIRMLELQIARARNELRRRAA